MAYTNFRLFSININYIHRPGLYYAPILSSFFREDLTVYEPIFSFDMMSQYDNYHNLSLNASKIFYFENWEVIAFVTLANLLNIKNEQNPIYNYDYSQIINYDLYQKRSVYFGFVFRVKF